MMNNGLNHGSATIYQFPVGGRAALAGRRYGDTRLPADHASLPANVSICSDSWYHQDAVDESKAQMGTLMFVFGMIPPRSRKRPTEV
ncbi:DUF2735 domain-containing protein [Bradyrhizobium japonicum]